jgi:hypothetical protein
MHDGWSTHSLTVQYHAQVAYGLARFVVTDQDIQFPMASYVEKAGRAWTTASCAHPPLLGPPR